jgi:hypothetical protein
MWPAREPGCPPVFVASAASLRELPLPPNESAIVTPTTTTNSVIPDSHATCRTLNDPPSYHGLDVALALSPIT